MTVSDLLRPGGPVSVWWVSLHPGILARGYADQAMLESLLDGSSWRAPLPRFEHLQGLPPGPDGGVVVIPGRWHADDVDEISEALDRMRWVLVIITGDEESIFPWRALQGPGRRIWVQTPRPDRHADADGLMGDGWWTGTRDVLRELGDLPRTLSWFYSGQLNNARRSEFHSVLSARADGVMRVTGGFASGYAQRDYLENLASAKIAPCPSGTFSPDTFRVFEALEAGCVPIVDTGTDAAAPGYWPFVFHVEPPFPVVTAWAEYEERAAPILADWPEAANRCGAWWMHEKRTTAHLMRSHLEELAGRQWVGGADDLITVLVPVSPIPSHPDPGILLQTIHSIRERLPTAEVILMFDGIRPEQEDRRAAYREFTRGVMRAAHREWVNVLPVVFDGHHHQSAMTAAVLPEVHTPLILFVEQDTPLIGPIPFGDLVRPVLSGEANVIRFHHEASVLEPHRHLMLDTTPQDVAGVPLLRTIQWSQRPHLASTEFYRYAIGRYFGPDARSFIEDVLHGVVQNRGPAGWEEFRLWMYAPPEPLKRSTHLDGRADDPKFPQTWAYAGPTPRGAPAPRVVVERVPLHGRRAGVKWGLIGRADRRGLAIQTTELARHLDPDRVLGIDMNSLSPTRPDWSEYDPERLTVVSLGDLTADEARRWLADLDVVVTAETFYKPWWTHVCKDMGVATILAPNPEFFAHVAAPDWAPLPDLLAAPTRWRLGEMPGAEYLPHGVDRARLPYRQRTEARTFLHVVGHAAKWDRAGTRILWEALQWVQSPIKMVVRSQTGASVPHRFPHVQVEVIDTDLPHYWDLYADGDVMILPRRYGGLCLPMQEALSTGMPVLMPNASPQSGVLPPGMLVECATERMVPSNVGPLAIHDTNPRALAARIDELANDPAEVKELSAAADEIADGLDWNTLAGRWCDVIEQVAAKRR